MRTADSSSIAFCLLIMTITSWSSCVDIADIEHQTSRVADALEKLADRLEKLEKNREKCVAPAENP